MASTNRVALSLIREAVLGVLPGSPTIRRQRMTGAPNFGVVPNTVVSEEITPDRQVSDLILVGAEAGGEVPFELSFRAQDDLLEAAFFNYYVRQPFRSSPNVGAVTLGSVALTNTSAGAFAQGDLVLFEGFGVAANNGLFTAGASTTGLVINATGLVAEAVPPATARIVRVGRLAASGDIVATAGTLASSLLTFTANPANADTVTIDGRVYTFQTLLTNVSGNVFIGATAADTRNNLVAAIMGAAGAGITYAAATIPHATVSAVATAGNMTATARVGGTGGNAIVTTESSANLSWAGGTLTGGAGTPALTSTALNFTTLGLQVGQWIKIGNGANGLTAQRFDTAGANAFARITSIAAGALGLFVDNTFASDAGAGKTLALFFSDFLTNGVTSQSFSAELRFTDHNPETVEVIQGCEVNTLSLEMEPQAVITGSATLFGTTGIVDSPVSPGVYSNIYSGTVTREEAPTHRVLNTSTNVARFGRGGLRVTAPNFVQNFTIELNNNLRRQEAVGVFGAAGIGEGEFSASGDMTTYFGDKTMLQAVIQNLETSIDATVRDTEGHAYVFDFPRIKFSEGAPDVPGKNQDVFINLAYQALKHATLGYTGSVSRFWYAL